MIEFAIYFLIFFLWHSLGISIGYHRVLSHKAVEIPRAWLYFLLAGGYLAMQGAPIPWASVHRYHHQVTDTEKDLHSPRRGFWKAFGGWMLDKNPDLDYLVPDLLEDPLLVWFGTGPLPAKPWLNLSLCFLWRVLIFIVLGPIAAGASFLCWILVFFLPHMINTFCHMVGYRNFETTDNSRNIGGLFSILTVGESLHNNHHRYPRRKTNKVNPGELDISGEILSRIT